MSKKVAIPQHTQQEWSRGEILSILAVNTGLNPQIQNTLFMDDRSHKTSLPQNRLETVRQWTLSWCFKRNLAQQVKTTLTTISPTRICRRTVSPLPSFKTPNQRQSGTFWADASESPWQPAAQSPQSRRANSKSRLCVPSGRGRKLMFDVSGEKRSVGGAKGWKKKSVGQSGESAEFPD